MKKTKFSKRIFGVGTLAMIAVPVAVAVSCSKGQNEDKDLKAWRDAIGDHEFTHQNDKFDLENKSGHDATIVSWVDGDTPVVRFEKPVKGKTEWKIRVAAIDTPELHAQADDGTWPETTGDEYIWAKKAKDFGDKVLPAGSKIRVITSDNKSYSRLVGSIFYKEKPEDKKYRSYSVDILNEGLALAFINVAKVNVINSVESLIGHSVADAYNNAFKNKKGLFSVDYKSILKVHGVTDDTNLRWRGTNTVETPNIYDMLGVKQGDK
ncbi:thermonuclease family protein [Mycoplasma todarodis]|uniref:TNase-like domain-containing protein n=1 Tax=Mycoplasma todarodis TaxID=1937191 RepID=A0A4R0XLG4_9MOLU|nr:thermonuclease family protein [Mycoplasma todarodis]TCG11314.1 hypothetical protein C4B25_01875 [Mycoplasma todarodis]